MDADLAPLLHVAPRTAGRTYDTARTVCALLPATLAAMRAGDLEPYRATAIAQEVPRLRPEICTRVEAALFPAVLDLPTAGVRAATRRAVAAADPDEVTRRARRAPTARLVRTRDGTCRFPGCATPARRCHLDHLTPYTHGGPTHPANLITLCQRHHRLKHHGGWTLTMTPTGTATWTNGTGQHYLTHPHDHRPTAA